MIFDSLDKLYLYEAAFPSLQTVRQILEDKDLLNKAPGSYTTEDSNCRYNICEYETVKEKEFEIHQKEADVQIMLEGSEVMTSAPRELGRKAKAYDKEQDITFVGGSQCVNLIGSPGYFTIFLPGEPHSPGLAMSSQEKVKKIVFKLKL